MVSFDFDEIVPRRGSGSYKWDTPEGDDVLPMWVADMDFRTAPAIVEALERRVAHGVFGYTLVPDEYYQAAIDWFDHRHGWRFERDWVIYTSGVVPAISAIIKAMTEPGDMVVVMTPSYNCFFSSIRNNGCELLANDLMISDNHYTIDFEGLERCAADPRAKVLLLCNPHNPVGRVWTRDELRRVGEICLRHGVFVISDEIHCELTYEGHDYTPFASLGDEFEENCAVCVSPSKAFNIAGLQIANIVARDADVRARIDRAININEVCDVNPFGVVASIAAYRRGAAWLDALRGYLRGNYEYLRERLTVELPAYPVLPLEGTYLVWLDCRGSGMTSAELAAKLLEEENLMVNPGPMYGSGGEGFLRLNIACPRSVLADALSRLVRCFTSAV